MPQPTTRYIPSHTSLGNHPKLLKLAKHLNVSKIEAVGHLHYFWWWAMNYAEDGCLDSFTPEDIAIACEWQGPEETLVNALTNCGFINPDNTLHDWDDYGGKLLRTRVRNAERQSDHRDRTTRNSDVTVTSPSPLKKKREEKRREEKSVSRVKREPLTDSWTPNDSGRAKARAVGMSDTELARQTTRFINHYLGTRNNVVDFNRAWLNWCDKYTPLSPNGRPQSTSSAMPIWKDNQ